MSQTESPAFAACFEDVVDPRVNRTKKHPLINIIFIAVCATISGADSYCAMQTFAINKRKWLEQYLDLSEGIPSHDTLNRVFARIDPQVFAQCLVNWSFAAQQATEGKVVAIDGKTMRGSYDRDGGSPLHVVSAWATENQVSLGQVTVDQKSNEITAIPALLDLLDVSGAFVTIDAMGCQREIAAKIREQDAHYVLNVKGNQPKLLEEVSEAFDEVVDTDNAKGHADEHTTNDKGHGRIEQRKYYVIDPPEDMETRSLWKDLEALGAVYSYVTHSDGRESGDVRYYILSHRMSAAELALAVRGHWGIENNLHWQLDVTFGEDACRAWRDHAPENLSVLRRHALGVLKSAAELKGSIRSRRFACGLNDGMREQVLFQ